MPNKGNGDLQADWREQRGKFLDYMHWLGVDEYHAEEAYRNIKNYKDLLKANKILKIQKHGTTPSRKRRAEKR